MLFRSVSQSRYIALGVKTPVENNDYSKIPSKDELSHIDEEIEKSRIKLYLPIVFRSVIGAVVFRNEVVNEDYSSAYLDSKLNGTFDTEGTTPDETHFIVLSPSARDDDVIKALQKYREQKAVIVLSLKSVKCECFSAHFSLILF